MWNCSLEDSYSIPCWIWYWIVLCTAWSAADKNLWEIQNRIETWVIGEYFSWLGDVASRFKWRTKSRTQRTLWRFWYEGSSGTQTACWRNAWKISLHVNYIHTEGEKNSDGKDIWWFHKEPGTSTSVCKSVKLATQKLKLKLWSET